jgi:hypothetical protein
MNETLAKKVANLQKQIFAIISLNVLRVLYPKSKQSRQPE